ncbi:endonuclease/exonuclease/phosphatase family protein [Hephaestia mangrovi]|uniref:endonuclease/exonuclease/phosphatase family protein n=1 Tax=Hephaestia mangrovi TaxID=2873268 RepID=UPI001CA741D7|nr:endonuclease/exonuclease/phosphatase family protein [Hephaestia mangrovi]MBY8827576.1 endonuclease/exonuclease/phosphatase family protein [Hephaestia mangrovi]
MKKFPSAAWFLPAIGATAMLLALATGRVAAAPQTAAPPAAAAMPFDGSLSVLTYNVHGLPWPLARNRPAAFRRIAARLAAMRAAGTAPQVVVMQEAFTSAAVAIGREAGYRYIVQGPDAQLRGADPDGAADAHFLAGARWLRGETEGPVLDSGLVILSDYPVVSTTAMAYPRDGCAGYDCLANKGVVLARIAVPGLATPVEIVTTHLNCRKETGVEDARADAAYQRELAAFDAFVARAHDPRLPMIVAGDFNVGKSAPRNRMIASTIAALDAQPAMATMVAEGVSLPPDALFSWAKNKDLQLPVSSPTTRLSVEAITTPFGHEGDGAMLSDHVGYVARYAIEPVDLPATAPA